VPSPQLKSARVLAGCEANTFSVRLLQESSEPNPLHPGVPQAPRSNGWRCRVIRAATAKEGFFAITVGDVDTIGVIVGAELERGAAVGKMFAGLGEEYHGR
jgi:hypothetical protein